MQCEILWASFIRSKITVQAEFCRDVDESACHRKPGVKARLRGPECAIHDLRHNRPATTARKALLRCQVLVADGGREKGRAGNRLRARKFFSLRATPSAWRTPRSA